MSLQRARLLEVDGRERCDKDVYALVFTPEPLFLIQKIVVSIHSVPGTEKKSKSNIILFLKNVNR